MAITIVIPWIAKSPDMIAAMVYTMALVRAAKKGTIYATARIIAVYTAEYLIMIVMTANIII